MENTFRNVHFWGKKKASLWNLGMSSKPEFYTKEILNDALKRIFLLENERMSKLFELILKIDK